MTRIETLWQSLRQNTAGTTIPEGGWTLIRIDPQHPFDIYAGLDSDGSVMLAISITCRPPAVEADTGALTYVRLQRTSGHWIMGLRLEGTGLEAVFGRLCQDLADAAAAVTTETALVVLFRERLLLWKRLFRDNGSGLLEKFQIKGLLAELLALEEFIAASPLDPLAPLKAWTGPGGTGQDFMFAGHAVEVKAVSPGADTVSISSARQLDAPIPLELRICELREGSPKETGALTLPQLAYRIEQLLTGTAGAVVAFRDKLLEAGYVEHDHYRIIAFTSTQTRRYAVQEGFPRLIPAGLPNGIADASYSILFNAIEAFLIPSHSHGT